jgi:hypothetical protein
MKEHPMTLSDGARQARERILVDVPEAERDRYVLLGNVCRQWLGLQAQYGTRYAGGVIRDGREQVPDLTTGEYGDGRTLRFAGDNSVDYHAMYIHEDDAAEYVRRVEAHRLAGMMIGQDTHDATIARLAEPLHARD